MVCNRCIKVVSGELSKLGFSIASIELGKVDLEEQLSESDKQKIIQMLLDNGFELIDDKKSRLVDQIKTAIINLIHYQKEKAAHINLSDFLSEEVGYDYSYLSNLFSSVEGLTIEKYIILQRIEKVKELLIYDELTLSEIAYRTGYSSVQHLSNQFKKTTGMSPSVFKKMQGDKRKPLDMV